MKALMAMHGMKRHMEEPALFFLTIIQQKREFIKFPGRLQIVQTKRVENRREQDDSPHQWKETRNSSLIADFLHASSLRG